MALWSGYIALGMYSGSVFTELSGGTYARRSWSFDATGAPGVIAGSEFTKAAFGNGPLGPFNSYGFFVTQTAGLASFVYPLVGVVTVQAGNDLTIQGAHIWINSVNGSVRNGLSLAPFPSLPIANLSGLAAVRTSKVKLSNKLSLSIISGSNNTASFTNSGGNNQTMSIVYNLEAAPYLIRFRYGNDINSNYAVGGAAYATSGTAPANDGTPTNSSGANDNTLWSQVTFNNAGADIDFIKQTAPPVTGATIVSGGTGGTTGTQIVTVAGCLGGSNLAPPQLSVTVSGGAITAVLSVVTAGVAGYIPPNPVSVTGGGLAGATLNLIPGSAVSISVPSNTDNVGVPSYVWSDWMPVYPVARTDGGYGSIVIHSIWGGVSTPTKYVGLAGGGLAPAINRACGADFSVTTNATVPPFTAPFNNPNTSFIPGFGCQYVSLVPGVTVLSGGDSIMMSLHSTGEISGPVVRACALASTPTLPVSFINRAASGITSPVYCTNVQSDADALNPQIVVLQGWSENDYNTIGTSLAVAQQNIQRVLAVANHALTKGAAVVLTTAAPVAVGNSSMESVRAAANAAIRTACSGGIFYLLDLDLIWGTGASPNAYQASYNFGDNTHPNDAGCAAAAVVLAEIINRITGSSS